MTTPKNRGGRPVTTGPTKVRTLRSGDVWDEAAEKWKTDRGDDNATMTDLVDRLLSGYVTGAITLPLRREDFTDANCRPATPADYRAWLDGHIAAGGRITHRYDYRLPSGWYVLTRDGATLPSLYGSASIELIVPAGMTLNIPATFNGAAGHNSVYFMDGYRAIPDCFVPTYPDVQ